jgi:MGT family glycosyltransferase
MFARVRDRVMFGPAREFCRDVLEELDSEPADLVAVDTLIPSALSGAEAAGYPSVLLMHGPYMMPRPDAPPPGTGFMPAHGPLGRWRDRTAASLMNRVFRTALPAFNQARAELGLAPVRDLADVINAASRVLVCTSPSYDFASATVPGYVRYVGPQLDDDADGTTWDDPGGPPLVLVSLSSTVMGHEQELLQRAVAALGELPVRGLVTTGPAVDPAAIRAPANVSVRRWVRHADVLPSCSAVLTHGGHGTVIKALTAGVPLVVAPLGRDQPDNAARVVHAGAGLRLSKKARVPALRDAIGRVLDEPRYRAAARRMAATLAAERDESLVVDELERAILSHQVHHDPSRR